MIQRKCGRPLKCPLKEGKEIRKEYGLVTFLKALLQKNE